MVVNARWQYECDVVVTVWIEGLLQALGLKDRSSPWV